MYGNSSSYSIAYSLGVIITSIICGCITKHMNENKGYSGGFAWGFWLHIIGIIVVACKPNNNSYSQKEYQPMYPQAMQPEKTWRCSSCGAENSDKLNYCLRCRSDRSVAQAEKVKCPHCGALNNQVNSTCFACHKSLAEIEVPKLDEQPTQKFSSSNESIALIKQLAELHSKGILTDEEFETKKAELLAKM